MNILGVFALFAIILKCVAASEDTFGVEFRKAVDEEDLKWLNRNRKSWWRRKDLFDDVIAKGVVVTIWFIQNFDYAKQDVLAALFDKGDEEMIGGVLGRVEYSGEDLYCLTNYRPELTGPPEKLFGAIDMIKDPEQQETVVCLSVANLLKIGRHDLVVPLVNAFGKRIFKSKHLKDEAIQAAFYWGARGGNQDIVELYYEHPAITSEKYADGLCDSWNNGKPNQSFQFLLGQADQGDLDIAKKRYVYKNYPEYRQAIDKALKAAPPAGSRIISVEKVQSVLKVFTSITGASDKYGPGSIIEEYLHGEVEVQGTGAGNPTD